MRRGILFPIILISIFLLAEIGSFRAVRQFISYSTSISLKKFTWIWWISTALLYVIAFTSPLYASPFLRNILVNILMLFVFTKLMIALVFIFASLFTYIRSFFDKLPKAENQLTWDSRRKFVSRLALASGLLPFVGLSWGILKTAYNFKIHRKKIQSAKIPKAFQGFKIVQISDIHTGTLQGQKQLSIAIDLIEKEKPDLIVFTGDIVNNKTDEAYEYKTQLSRLKAPHGVFSILGNHDYGDYHSWDSPEAKDENMRAMIDLHRDLGWNLMLNEHVQLEKDGEAISLIGIENWGAYMNFKKYGDLHKAYETVDSSSFQILLSHDPSHWAVQVVKDFKHIDLMLAGHTHGFQFGIEIPGVRWSPSQYVYPHWGGLYQEGEQQLYVNRGLGCLGYMGRVGIRPEITVLELAPLA